MTNFNDRERGEEAKHAFDEENAFKVAARANRLLGEYYRDKQSLDARAGVAATDSVLGLPRDFSKSLIDKAAKLTPAEVQAVAQKYLDEKNLYNMILLP